MASNRPFRQARERGRVAVGLGYQPREEAVRQQAHVLGEQAEDDAVEEAGDALGIVAALAQEAGDLGDPLGGVLRDALGASSRASAPRGW